MNEWYKYVTYTDMIRIWANKQSFLIKKKIKIKWQDFYIMFVLNIYNNNDEQPSNILFAYDNDVDNVLHFFLLFSFLLQSVNERGTLWPYIKWEFQKKLIKEKILCCKDVNIKLKGSIKIKIKKRKKKITQNQSWEKKVDIVVVVVHSID